VLTSSPSATPSYLSVSRLEEWHDTVLTPVGKPIHVEKDSKPSDEKVQEFHRLYIEELKR